MSYHAELYDLVTPAAFHGDVAWYCGKAVESGGPVLERGAGTGRITLPIAAAGIAIHALDADTSMLQRLRSKLAAAPLDVQARITIVAGDMRTFDIAERFALIICPFRAFLHNVWEADRRACLTRVRQHLRPSRRPAPPCSVYPSDIRRELEAAGFKDIAIHGGFNGGEFSEDGQALVVEALRDV